jgi:Rrf2 family protein
MALMSRKVDYALLVLSYLHQHPGGKCAREAAEHFGLSRAFVANILKELCQKGFVSSHRGARGGYVLRRPLDQLSLAEMMEALDDTFHLAECTREPAGDGCCFVDVCPVRDPIAEVHRRVAELLRQVTLAELLGAGLPLPTVPVGRERLVTEVRRAREEFEAGECRVATVKELMEEALKD